jgi:hypothetical protein
VDLAFRPLAANLSTPHLELQFHFENWNFHRVDDPSF